MTPMTELLKNGPNLCRLAFEQTGDVNEAYLLAHNVMGPALTCANGRDQNVDLAMATLLDARLQRTGVTDAAI